MRYLLALLLFPSATLAATTWSTDATQDTSSVRISVATCTTGTEAAPVDGVGTPPQGLDLGGVKGFAVKVEAAAALTAGGQIQAYLYNPITAKWLRAPDLDLTVSALQHQAFAGFEVVSDWGRIAYVPNGVGQAVTIYLEARKR